MRELIYERDRFKLSNPSEFAEGRQPPHFRSRYFANMFRDIGEVVVKSPSGYHTKETTCYIIMSESEWCKYRTKPLADRVRDFE